MVSSQLGDGCIGPSPGIRGLDSGQSQVSPHSEQALRMRSCVLQIFFEDTQVVGISETDSFHDTEPGPLPIHSVRSADHCYQKSFPHEIKERPSKMH